MSSNIPSQENPTNTINTTNINHTIIYSPNDKNKYYRDILPNGLQYVVISNPSIDRSAVGLDVRIGSAEDPRDYQGLAHCLEHTIFLGSKKYPEASGFDNYLNNNSGTNNANTSLEIFDNSLVNIPAPGPISITKLLSFILAFLTIFLIIL